jgi:hypothetical protein
MAFLSQTPQFQNSLQLPDCRNLPRRYEGAAPHAAEPVEQPDAGSRDPRARCTRAYKRLAELVQFQA